MAEIRRATPADTPAMIAMGRALHDESPRYRDKAFSERKLLALSAHLHGTLLGGPDVVLLVAVSRGELVGMAIGVAAERFFSEERYVTDLTVYVKPESRGSSAFVRLVRALEGWAAEIGVPDLALGVSTGIHAAKTVHTYEKLGYTLNGHTVIKTLNLHGN